VSLDPKELLDQLAKAVDDLRGASGAGPGGILRLWPPEQRELCEVTQSMMSLLEGHASYVMTRVADGVVGDLPRLQAALARRRSGGGREGRAGDAQVCALVGVSL